MIHPHFKKLMQEAQGTCVAHLVLTNPLGFVQFLYFQYKMLCKGIAEQYYNLPCQLGKVEGLHGLKLGILWK